MAVWHRRTDRVEAACDGALARLVAKESQGVNPDVFTEVGEVLFWLYALASARHRHKDAVFKGLGWARDRIAHGMLVWEAPVQWRYGSELGRWVIGRGQLGVRSAHMWLASDKIPLGPNDRKAPTGREAYDQHLAGREVVQSLREALDQLR